MQRPLAHKRENICTYINIKSICNGLEMLRISSETETPQHELAKKQIKELEHFNTNSEYSKSLEVGSHFKSDFKEIFQRSAKSSYSHSEENYFELSKNRGYKVYEASLSNCVKKLHYDGTSVSSDSYVNDSVSHQERCSGYSSGEDIDFSKRISSNPSSMSRTHSLYLSEQSSSKVSNSLARRNISNSNSRYGISSASNIKSHQSNMQTRSGLQIESSRGLHRSRSRESSGNFGNHSQNSSNYAGNMHIGDSGNNVDYIDSSSDISMQSVQTDSFFNQFRWCMWKYIYLSIIRNISLDVWLLSRLHAFGRFKCVFILFSFFLLFILYGCPQSYNSFTELLNTIVSVASSSSIFALKTVASTLKCNSNEDAEFHHVTDNTQESGVLNSLYHFLTYFFSKSSENPFPIGEDAKPLIEENKEEIGLHDTEISKEELLKFIRKYKDLDPDTKELRTKVKKVIPRESKEEIRLLIMQLFKEELLKFEEKYNDLAHDTKEFKTEVEKLISKESKEEIRILITQLFKEELQKFEKKYDYLDRETKLKAEVEKSSHKESKEEIRLLFTQLLKEELLKFKKKYSDLDLDNKELKTEIEKLSLEFNVLSTAMNKLNEEVQLSNQQRDANFKSANNFEADHVAALKEIMNSESQETSQYQFFHNWLNTKFMNHESLVKETKLALQECKSKHPTRTDKDMKIVIEQIVAKYVDSLKADLSCTKSSLQFSKDNSDLLFEEKIRKMIKEAIRVYDADKTGKADYALESGGGSVIGTRCSETFVEKSGTVSIFGLPLWSRSNTPRTVIQPTMQPGECWAFKGSQGFLVLELSSIIYPSGFTLEHIPVSLSPVGSIDSAPKEFSVWGLSSKDDNTGKMLGKYIYDIKGEPLQYFPIENFIAEPFQYVELKIHSNHGNLAYTCLYRFRVHGTRV